MRLARLARPGQLGQLGRLGRLGQVGRLALVTTVLSMSFGCFVTYEYKSSPYTAIPGPLQGGNFPTSNVLVSPPDPNPPLSSPVSTKTCPPISVAPSCQGVSTCNGGPNSGIACTVNGDCPMGSCDAVCQPLCYWGILAPPLRTEGMKITGTVVFNGALGVGLVDQDVTGRIVGWTFNDSTRTLDARNSTLVTATVSTDATGAISEWNFIAEVTAGTDHIRVSFDDDGSANGISFDEGIQAAGVFGRTTRKGTWKQTSQ